MFPHVCKVSSDENSIKSFILRIEKALLNSKTIEIMTWQCILYLLNFNMKV